MLKTENRIEVVGTVSNFKIMKNDKTGKKRAFITIKDSKANNYTSVTMYDRENLKYGDQEVTLGALKKIFLDANDKSNNVLVHAIGSCSESYDDDIGKLYENNNVFFINPCDDVENQKSVFAIKGFIETIKKFKETDEAGDEKECIRVKIGTYAYKSGTDQNEVTGVNHKTLIARGEAAEKLEDLGKGAYVVVGGRIFNQLPPRDEFGLQSGNGKKEYAIAVVKSVIDADDVDEDEAKLFSKANKLKIGDSMSLVVKDEAADVDEEAFD